MTKKLNVFKKNGGLLTSVDVPDGETTVKITGLGYQTEYNAGDLLVQWETDGKVSPKMAIDSAFVTLDMPTETTVEPTTIAPTTVAPASKG